MTHKHKHTEEQDLPVEENVAEEALQADSQAESQSDDSLEQQKITALETELAEVKEKLIYLQADYQNYRKRVVKDLADARMYGLTSAVDPFLTVYDFLNMAKVASEKSDNIESIRQGLSMIMAQFVKAFDDLGVKKLDTIGKEFDPACHEAAAQEASEEAQEGTILKEWTGGYKLGDHLLRPARVVVSTGPAKPEEQAEPAK